MHDSGSQIAQLNNGARVLIYSHDSFGLGHLRRCRTIAHALVEKYKSLSVLIISGSPIIGSFDFRARVDFVRIPGVIKLHSGEYTSLALHIDLQQTLALREAIILSTAVSFRPDIFLVDKEPTGLQGEVVETLRQLKQLGCVNILGLRDVMDDPQALRDEWARKKVVPVIEECYDRIWVYGPREMGNPISAIDLSVNALEKIRYTGYLRRNVPAERKQPSPVDTDIPYYLVTTGGGGDGVELVDWVLRAYEQHHVSMRAVIVLGPFMSADAQVEFNARAAELSNVEMLTFDSNIEFLMRDAVGVVAMGGYNTFCEVLSFDKRAVLVPRYTPREEQLVRVRNAAKLGLVNMLDAKRYPDASLMSRALNGLADQQLPSALMDPGMLDGLDRVADLVEPLMQSADRVDIHSDRSHKDRVPDPERQSSGKPA
jgi:predicted glycosyltransferase